jgi:hypothetical protein
MLELFEPLASLGIWVLQFIGLASVVLARLPRAGWMQACCRTCFFGCLAFVALATMLAIGCRSECWIYCGTTFSLMAVGATLDFSGPLRITGF